MNTNDQALLKRSGLPDPVHPGKNAREIDLSIPVRETRIEVWGLKIFYLTAGENGPPVLLIHGGGSDFSGFAWKYTIDALAKQYRVFAVDLPGYGQSQAPKLRIANCGLRTSDWGFEISEDFIPINKQGCLCCCRDHPGLRSRKAGIASLSGWDLKEDRKLLSKKRRINPFWFHIHFINAFLDKLGLKKVNLVGISMGGGISIGVALENPQCVEKLVLVNSYGLGDKIPRLSGMYIFSRVPFLYELLRRLLHRSRKLVALGMRQLVYSPAAPDEEIIDDAWRTLKKSGMHRTWQAFQICEILPTRFRTDFSDLLPGISAPTLLIHGDQDKLMPVQWTKRAHTLFPDSQLHIFKDCGHLPPREKPGEFVQLLSNFLK
jgi:pimeloyl-ACP methyl ester carboxylesterase